MDTIGWHSAMLASVLCKSKGAKKNGKNRQRSVSRGSRGPKKLLTFVVGCGRFPTVVMAKMVQ